MPRSLAFIAGFGLLLIVIAMNTMFIVRQDRQAIILNLGQYQRTINAPGEDNPGLHFKIPFVEQVIIYDKRNIGTALEAKSFVGSDQETLIVDAVIRWRIVNPRRFYQSALTEEQGATRLEVFAEAAMRRALGAATSIQIIREQRAQLMQAIERDLNQAAAAQLGVSVIDVRIRQADLPEATLERVYDRMRSERAQVAGRIRAEAERDATIIRAEAQEESARLRGEGDGERARIFAQAYGRDPEFAAFYRSMRAYETALDAGTPIVVAPDSEFFRYMRSRTGGGR